MKRNKKSDLAKLQSKRGCSWNGVAILGWWSWGRMGHAVQELLISPLKKFCSRALEKLNLSFDFKNQFKVVRPPGGWMNDTDLQRLGVDPIAAVSCILEVIAAWIGSTTKKVTSQSSWIWYLLWHSSRIKGLSCLGANCGFSFVWNFSGNCHVPRAKHKFGQNQRRSYHWIRWKLSRSVT